MTRICLDALHAVVRDADEHASRIEAELAKTPNGYEARPLMAPMWRFSIKRRPGLPMLFRARTREQGPVDLMRLVQDGEDVQAEAILTGADARVANPELAEQSHSLVLGVLAKIDRMERPTCADQARILYEPLSNAAILLLDPDTVARQRRIRRYFQRMQALHGDEIYYDLSGFAYHGGGPGLGKRA
jgi:hypothetical protein